MEHQQGETEATGYKVLVIILLKKNAAAVDTGTLEQGGLGP